MERSTLARPPARQPPHQAISPQEESFFRFGTSSLVLNHTDETGTYVFAPDLESTGTGANDTILHEAGWTGLTGDGSTFKGATDINGGVLSVNKVLAGTVNVNSGGTLGGTGSIAVNSDGTQPRAAMVRRSAHRAK